MDNSVILLLVITLPMVGFLSYLLFPKFGFLGYWNTGLIFLSFLGALLLNLQLTHPVIQRFQWFSLSPDSCFHISFYTDQISTYLLALVTLISFLVHFFSLEYMKSEQDKGKYFGYLGLFTFSMLVLLFSDHLLLFFMSWELVGFSSYLLIGFWYKNELAAHAANKAFLVNRLGDIALLSGILLLWTDFQTFSIQEILTQTSTIHASTLVCLLVLVGMASKSAQFPFLHWLPDAMAGPTPVSALIHAATMVAAGVYLGIRLHPIFDENTLMVLACLGAFTSLVGALSALSQHDVKKVLAYSTISQLGFMFLSIGVGSPDAALFHLFTHAFFKAGLFLIAGALVHQIHLKQLESDISFDAYDMRQIGNLKQSQPLLYYSYAVCMLSLAGIPLFSGFLSKDAILLATANWLVGGSILHWIIITASFVVVFLTPVYIGRQFVLIFISKASEKAVKITETLARPSFFLIIPVIVLSILSTALIFTTNPLSVLASNMFVTFNRLLSSSTLSSGHTFVPLSSILLSIGGFSFIWLLKRSKTETISSNLQQPWFRMHPVGYWDTFSLYLTNRVIRICGVLAVFDKQWLDRAINYFTILVVVVAHVISWVDRNLVDGLVNTLAFMGKTVGKWFSGVQNGSVQAYLYFTMLIALLVLLFLIF
jgi:NADH-quinone oxidoreductase subunit L